MAIKVNCFLAGTLSAVVVASLFLHVSAVLGGQKDSLPGRWNPITNTKDPQIVEIGKFAIDEHNKEAKTKMVFKKVMKGDIQVVAGVNYKLVIAAKDGLHHSHTHRYLALLWDKPWENHRNLTYFQKL